MTKCFGTYMLILMITIFCFVGCNNDPSNLKSTFVADDLIESGLELDTVEDELIMYHTMATESMFIGESLYSIRVDGSHILYMASEEEATAVLKTLKERYEDVSDYMDDNNIEGVIEQSTTFIENVEIVKVKSNIFASKPIDYVLFAVRMIIEGDLYSEIHVVKAGENFWSIALKYEVNVQDLIDFNKGLTESILAIDVPLVITKQRPNINVITKAKLERIDSIPFDKGLNELTNRYYIGEYKMKQEGVEGKRKVLTEVYFQNGRYIGEKIITTEIIVKPVEEIVYEGTKEVKQ